MLLFPFVSAMLRCKPPYFFPRLAGVHAAPSVRDGHSGSIDNLHLFQARICTTHGCLPQVVEAVIIVPGEMSGPRGFGVFFCEQFCHTLPYVNKAVYLVKDGPSI